MAKKNKEMKVFDDIIVMLMAIANYAKDIHYTCAGQAAYSKHLFADLLQDDLYDFIDDLKENAYLGQQKYPESSRVYLLASARMIPSIKVEDKEKFLLMAELIDETRIMLEQIEAPTRGVGSLLDNICEHLDKCAGLLFLQTRDDGSEQKVSEGEFKKETCKGCVEREVDRAKAEVAEIDRKKVADRVLDYEAQNLLVAEEEKEESALDRVAGKLGI